jgi:Xaa-Pro aminopeptidase
VTKPAEFDQRRLLAGEGLAVHKVQALVVSSAANIRYLSGFTGSNGLMLLLPERVVLFTDPRYKLQAASETAERPLRRFRAANVRERSCFPVEVRAERGSLLLAAATWIRRKSLRRIGYEKNNISHQSFLALEDPLPASARLIPVASLVETLRMVKSPGEIDLIRRSVQTNSEAFAQTLALVRPGVTEIDLAAELEYRMRRLGAEKPAFDSIVAFGPRSAFPHASPTRNKLAKNSLILMDMGAMRDGYASDMTRMAFLGRPGTKVRKLHKAVLEAQLAALAAVREGVTAESIDRTARRVLRAHGLDRAFVHATGHGLGLEIHEMPRLGKGDQTPLRAGMAVTVEPGVYLQELGGVRIEDTVAVTRTGCEILTATPKELVVI